MTLKSLVAGLLAGVLCVSCGRKDPGTAAAGSKSGKTLAGAADTSKQKSRTQGEVRLPGAPVVPAPDASSDNATGANTAAAANAADLSDMPLAPKDAQWTIYCATLADPDHVTTSRGLKAALIKRTNMREWYILHENTQSRLYYGFYRSINDPKDAAESKRAQADRKKIDELVDGSNQRPFRACQFVQLSAPDPESPPQWNLVNLPPDKVWSLMIGAYKDHPDRKKFAVEAVRDARAAGEEAYYFHGDNVSNVFVGAWPEDAVSEVRYDPDPAARRSGAGDVLVVPPGMKADAGVRDKSGKRVSVVSQQLVPVDESLKKKIEQYPNMGVNGEFLVYKARGKQRLEGSKVVRIPRPSQTLFRDNVAAGAGTALEPQDPFSRPGYEDNAAVSGGGTRRPSKSGGTGTGGLRSIDGK